MTPEDVEDRLDTILSLYEAEMISLVEADRRVWRLQELAELEAWYDDPDYSDLVDLLENVFMEDV